MHLNLVKGTLSQLNLTWILHYITGGKSSLKWTTDLASIDSASSQRRKEREWRGQSYYPGIESEVNVFQFRILVTTFYIHVHLQFEKCWKIPNETLRTGPTYDEIISCGIQETEWTFQETGRGCIQDLGQNERKLAMKWNAFFLPSFTCSFNLKQQSVRQFLLLIHSVPAAGLAEHTELNMLETWSVSYLKLRQLLISWTTTTFPIKPHWKPLPYSIMARRGICSGLNKEGRHIWLINAFDG